MSPQHLHIDVSTDGDVAVLGLRGELDVASTPLFAETVGDQTGAGRAHVVVDLAELSFVDTTGISAFVSASKKLYARGGWLRLENVSGMPRQVLELTGVYELLTSPTAFAEPTWSVDGLALN